MEFRILGPLEADEGGPMIALGGAKQRALLAMFLLHANQVVSTERLIDALWESPPANAVKAVQVYVSRLRKALGGMPTNRPPGYILEINPEQLDLARFRQLRDQARRDRVGAAEKLTEALALWRGPALAEFAAEPFALPERLRLEEERLEALEERIEADLSLGRHSALVGELEVLVATQPLRERLRGQLMLALYRCGRQAEALAIYQQGRLQLVEELGIEPSRALQRLERMILQQDTRLELFADEVAADSGRGVFVGRQRELEQMTLGLDEAFAGHGRLLLLVGEPGIGKSWLANELLVRSRARGGRVLVGRCWEAGGAPAYWPWVQSLRAVVREAPPDRLRELVGAGGADLAPLFPELRRVLPDLPESSALESESARFRLFDAITSFVKAAASERPIVLLLDDLHAADEPSLLLLRFVARELAETQLLILGAYRDVDPTIRDPLLTALTELVRERVTRRIEVSGLTQMEVAEYISRSTNRVVDATIVAEVHAQTEGNSLFVAEVTRLLDESGAFAKSDTNAHLGIPPGVREVLGRRLRRLSAETHDVLTAASVLGREFSLDALARLRGIEVGTVLDLLDESVVARVASEVPGVPGTWRFTHVLFREALYEDLTSKERLRLHRSAAEVLETMYADNLDVHLSELAHHFAASSPAGGSDKAVSYARLAGNRAADLLAFEEAARLYRVALDLTDADPRQRCELLLAMGDVQTRAGDMPAARENFVNAADLASRIGSAELLARAAVGYGGRLLFTRATNDDRLVPLLERAAKALGEEGTALRVNVQARLANALSQSLPEVSNSLSSEALEIARRLDESITLDYAISARLYATRAPTNLDERWTLTEELIGARDRERAFEGHAYRTIIRFARGDVPGIRVDLAAMDAIAEELGQPSQRWWTTATSATLALLEGRFDSAERLIEHARMVGERTQSYDARNFFQVQRFALRREQGRLAEVITEFQQTAEADPSRTLLRCGLGLAWWELGRKNDARRLLSELAEDQFAQLPVNNDWLYSAALLAELIAATAQRQPAAALYERLVPFDGLCVDTEEVSNGAVARYLGLLAATSKRFEEAADHFESAIEMNERMGARPWIAHAQNDYAQMLFERDKRGDRERAHQLRRDVLFAGANFTTVTG